MVETQVPGWVEETRICKKCSGTIYVVKAIEKQIYSHSAYCIKCKKWYDIYIAN